MPGMYWQTLASRKENNIKANSTRTHISKKGGGGQTTDIAGHFPQKKTT